MAEPVSIKLEGVAYGMLSCLLLPYFRACPYYSEFCRGFAVVGLTFGRRFIFLRSCYM